MAEPEARVLRILTIHPEEAICQSIDDACRRVSPLPATVYHSLSFAEGLERARRIDPRVVLLDLGSERELALDVASSLRRPGRLLVGVYNPLILRDNEAEFFRLAARAGIGDFVPVPVSDQEMGAALAVVSADFDGETESAEGRMISFVSHKGGVGTTTLAVNTALMLAGSDEIDGEVAFCDAALPFGEAAAFLSLAPDRDLSHLAENLDDVGALSAYLAEEPQTGLRMLAGPEDAARADAISPDDLCRCLLQLRRRFELVVVDTPPVLDLLTVAILDLSESIFVVTEAVTPTVLATARFLAALEAVGIEGDRVRVILNRFRNSDANLAEGLVVEQLHHGIDFRVDYDEALVTAATRGVPLLFGRGHADFADVMGEIADSAARGRH